MRHIIVWFYKYKTNKCIKTYLTSYKTDLIDHPRVFFNFPNGLPWADREARIWNNVFERAEKMVGIEKGSIRATVLIETLPAVFQMDEILYELRDHSVGLNCGRWDYIFSYVKTFQSHPDRLLPDRVLVGMGQHFMRSYSDLLIRTCHRRGVHAMGGMVCSF